MSEETLRGWYWAGVIVAALALWVPWYMLARACTHKSPSHVRFRANRTSSRHRRMTESDPSLPFDHQFCCCAQRGIPAAMY
jgi:hypothetical protein